MSSQYNLITILGPTATGKTKLAAQLATSFDGEIISADSRQVYRRMDIGTGKDLGDYRIDDTMIPYHLINIIEPSEEFNVYLFQKYFNDAFKKISDNEKTPFLVGGTGFYISSIIQGYELTPISISDAEIDEIRKTDIKSLEKLLIDIKPHLHNTTDLLVRQRLERALLIAKSEQLETEKKAKSISIKSLTLGIHIERPILKERIRNRLSERLENGMIEEVEALLDEGITHEKLKFFGLEYKYVSQFLTGEINNKNDLFQKLSSAIYQFSKRQMTWFRKMEKEGVVINWIDAGDIDTASEIIEKEFLNNE